jgi:hypothetical protein
MKKGEFVVHPNNDYYKRSIKSTNGIWATGFPRSALKKIKERNANVLQASFWMSRKSRP